MVTEQTAIEKHAYYMKLYKECIIVSGCMSITVQCAWEAFINNKTNKQINKRTENENAIFSIKSTFVGCQMYVLIQI